MVDFSKFEKIIGFDFSEKDLLRQAFTHRSYLNENPSWKLDHNERLEFLGDAVLELVVTQYLFDTYPDKPEGELTSYRAALVNANMLYQVADDLDMNSYLLLSRGEKKDSGRARQYIMANAFEALVGAIYIDQGYEAVRLFISRFLLPYINDVLEKKLFRDSKSIFQEESQERLGVTPAYKVLKEWGPDHAKNFSVGVYLDKELVADGEGVSKQDAQQEAARKGLEIKGWGE